MTYGIQIDAPSLDAARHPKLVLFARSFTQAGLTIGKPKAAQKTAATVSLLATSLMVAPAVETLAVLGKSAVLSAVDVVVQVPPPAWSTVRVPRAYVLGAKSATAAHATSTAPRMAVRKPLVLMARSVAAVHVMGSVPSMTVH